MSELELERERARALQLRAQALQKNRQPKPPEPVGPVRGPDSTLSVAPGTTPDQAANIPQGMVFDPSTGGYADTTAQARRMGPAMGLVGEYLRGTPFVGSFVDEAIGRLPGTGATPEVGQERVRELSRITQEERPGQAIAASLTGGVVSGVGMGAAAAPIASPIVSRLLGSSLARRTVAGAGLGAAAGAIEGATYGYGAGDSGNRGQSAQTGALLGGLVGGGVGGMLPLAGAGVENIAQRLLNSPERAAGKALGVSPEVARVARSLVGQEPPQSAIANIQRGGQGAMLADVGPAPQGMLDAALQVPGPGQALGMQRIEGRAAGAMNDITQALDQSMGAPQGRLGARDAIRDATRPQVNQAYQQAYSTPIDYTSDAGRNIESIIDRLPGRKVQAAIADATDRMIYDGAPSPQIMASIGDDGKVTFQQMPNVMQLDYIKRSFDQMARDGTDPITQRMSSDAAFAARVARDLRDAIADAVPGYRDALSQAADSMGQQSAIDFGATMLRPQVTRETVARRIVDMTDAERQAVRLGVRQQIDDALANIRAVPSNRNIDAKQAASAYSDLSSPAVRAKITELMGGGADDLFRQLDEAGEALGLRANVAVNSRTEARKEGIRVLRDQAQPNLVLQSIASPTQAYKNMTESLMGTGKDMTEERLRSMASEIIDLLTRQGGAEAERALRLLQDVNLSQPLAEAQAKLVANTVMQTIGATGYQTSMQSLGTR